MNIPLNTLLDKDGLKERLCYANTPIYLYSHFRRDTSVYNLSQKYGSDELLNELELLLKKPVTEIDVAVNAYALLASLSFKPSYELARLKKLSSANLDWFSRIKKLVLEDAPTDNKVVFEIENKPTFQLIQDTSTAMLQKG